MRRFFFLTFLVLSTLTAVSAAADDGGTSKPAAQQAWRLIDDGALLIDVRTRSEYEEGHLENAINIPHENVAEIVDSIGEDKDRKVVVYCRSGRRSGIVQELLRKSGYRQVHNGMGFEDLKAVKANKF